MSFASISGTTVAGLLTLTSLFYVSCTWLVACVTVGVGYDKMNDQNTVLIRQSRVLLITVALLLIVGFIFIYSASSIYALAYAQRSSYFVLKQLGGLVLALIFVFGLMFVPARVVYRWAWVWLIIAIGLTALTLIPLCAVRIHGSSRWLRIGGFVFQSSEILKWAVIIFIAYVLDRKEHLIKHPWRRYIPIVFVLSFVGALLLRQPDFGMVVTLGATVICLFFIAYPDWHYVAWLCIAAIPALAVLIYKEPYRFKRILIFLNPWQDPQGAGFQIIQSLIAIGSGGLLGQGVGHSHQKFFYLPMQHTDFIFSIIAEETGFLGVCVLVFLYIIFLFKGFQLSWQFEWPFARYVTQGFVLLLSIQAVINMAVAIGLFPTKGIGLPFVSYGNSALLANIGMLGVVLSLVRAQCRN